MTDQMTEPNTLPLTDEQIAEVQRHSDAGCSQAVCVLGEPCDIGYGADARYLATIAAKQSEIATLTEQLNAERMKFEEHEAAICPEDVGCAEYIATLTATNKRLSEALEKRGHAEDCALNLDPVQYGTDCDCGLTAALSEVTR